MAEELTLLLRQPLFRNKMHALPGCWARCVSVPTDGHELEERRQSRVLFLRFVSSCDDHEIILSGLRHSPPRRV